MDFLANPETRIEIDLHDIDRAADNFALEAFKRPHLLANYRDGLADLGARLTAIAAELPRASYPQEDQQ